MSDSNTQQQENTDPLENGDLVSSLANLRSILMVEDAASSGGQSSKSLRGWSKAEERIKVLEKQLNEELSLREKQDSSYQSLSEYNKTLSMELELLTESRASMEEKANMSNRALRTEKAQFARKEEEWKAEMIKVTAEKSKSINECERLKARSQYYQQQNEELNDYSKNLRAEIAKLKSEIEAKEVQYCEKHKEETTLQEKLKMCLEETEKTKNAEIEKLKGILKDTKDNQSSAMVSLRSFVTAMKEDSPEAEDSESTDMEAVVSNAGAAMDEMRKTVADLRDDKRDLVKELEIVKTENDETMVELAASREKWRSARDKLIGLKSIKEDYEEQNIRISELEDQLEAIEDKEIISSSLKQKANYMDEMGSAQLEEQESGSPMEPSDDEPGSPFKEVKEINDDETSTSSHEGVEMLSPAKRSADVRDEANYDSEIDSESEVSESAIAKAPKRLKVDEGDSEDADDYDHLV